MLNRKGKLLAVALDLDGTLFNAERRVSEGNLAALRACARRGILLCPATARAERLYFLVPTPLNESATYVTRSNDEDGVAFALGDYVGIP